MGASDPVASVVIPTHNRSALVRRTLRSVLAQDVPVEVIVVDDGSKDDTAEALAAFADPRLRVVRNDVSTGVAAARNRGLALANAPWTGFVDDDDLWAPTKLRAQVDALAATDRRWAMCGAVWIDRSHRVVRHDQTPAPDLVAELLLHHNAVPGGGSGVIASTELLRDIGGFDERFSSVADWELWIRLARGGLPAPAAGPLVAYTWHPGGMSRNRAAMYDELVRLHDLHGVEVPPEPDDAEVDVRTMLDVLATGRRRELLPFLLRSARTERDRRSVKALLLGTASPRRLADRLERRQLARLPDGWADELAAWLRPYRTDG